MAMIYKKYNLNPITGCIFALIQLPLFIAFLEAINRVPAIYEETFLGFQLGTVPLTGMTNGNFIYIILTLLVGASTYYSLKVNSASNPDNAQVKTMNKVMFFMILVMSVFMSSALNIYWITTNAFTIVQNLLVMKKRKKV
jgi:YidC/Oxa1 family membrane protein insertase